MEILFGQLWTESGYFFPSSGHTGIHDYFSHSECTRARFNVNKSKLGLFFPCCVNAQVLSNAISIERVSQQAQARQKISNLPNLIKKWIIKEHVLLSLNLHHQTLFSFLKYLSFLDWQNVVKPFLLIGNWYDPRKSMWSKKEVFSIGLTCILLPIYLMYQSQSNTRITPT